MSNATTTNNSIRSKRRMVIAFSAVLGIIFAVLMISAIGVIIDTFGLGQRASFLPLAIVCAIYGAVSAFIASVVMPEAEQPVRPAPTRRVS